MKIKDIITEARKNPEQNSKFGSGKMELVAASENIRDISNWGVSMTLLPKLGINPHPGVSDDTPKGIYFYPLRYFLGIVRGYKQLPWGDNLPYMQLFEYDNTQMMTPKTTVSFDAMKEQLLQYVTEDDIRNASDVDNPLWFIYNALSNGINGDERIIIVWNKILRNLGFTVLLDEGRRWIAYNEPYQGCILDPRAIKQQKTFTNYVQGDKINLQTLIDNLYLHTGFLYKISSEIRKQLSIKVAKEMLRQFVGMNPQEAKQNGYEEVMKQAVAKVIEALK
jgi:hypothetical protein